MAKALVAWTREHIENCDVIHAHEWGGLLADLATLDNYRQLKPGPFLLATPLKMETLFGLKHSTLSFPEFADSKKGLMGSEGRERLISFYNNVWSCIIGKAIP